MDITTVRIEWILFQNGNRKRCAALSNSSPRRDTNLRMPALKSELLVLYSRDENLNSKLLMVKRIESSPARLDYTLRPG